MEIEFKEIMGDYLRWSENYSQKLFREKIFRVYLKCLKRNHAILASKILKKYKSEILNDNIKSDMAIAMTYSLIASKTLQ